MKVFKLYMALVALLLIVVFFISYLLEKDKNKNDPLVNYLKMYGVIKNIKIYGTAFLCVNIFLNFKMIQNSTKWINALELVLSIIVVLLCDLIKFKYIRFTIYLVYILFIGTDLLTLIFTRIN